MLAVDNFVQDPFSTQSYNRYSYCWNNPLKFTDPSGEFVATLLSSIFCPYLLPAAIYFDFFTDAGYQTQKYVSPAAFKVDWNFGTHRRSLGYEISLGTPKLLSFGQLSERWSYGQSYNWKTYGGYKGWETRKGNEKSTWLGLFSNETMKYKFKTKDNKFSQTIGTKSYGIRGLLSFEISNDMSDDGYNGDGGDRWRSAAGRLSITPFFTVGLNLFTGDPGPPGTRQITNGGPYGTYGQNGPYDPDEYRNGILYAEFFGIFRLGWDSEDIRNYFQNTMVHDKKEIPRFRVTKQKSRFYLGLGNDGIW